MDKKPKGERANLCIDCNNTQTHKATDSTAVPQLQPGIYISIHAIQLHLQLSMCNLSACHRYDQRMPEGKTCLSNFKAVCSPSEAASALVCRLHQRLAQNAAKLRLAGEWQSHQGACQQRWCLPAQLPALALHNAQAPVTCVANTLLHAAVLMARDSIAEIVRYLPTKDVLLQGSCMCGELQTAHASAFMLSTVWGQQAVLATGRSSVRQQAHSYMAVIRNRKEPRGTETLPLI